MFDNKNWSFFAVARYGSGVEANQERIFVSGETDKNWLIGHHEGKTGVAFYNTWLTDFVKVLGTSTWIRITAQHNNFETNGQ